MNLILALGQALHGKFRTKQLNLFLGKKTNILLISSSCDKKIPDCYSCERPPTRMNLGCVILPQMITMCRGVHKSEQNLHKYKKYDHAVKTLVR